mmetsp:Transcript_109314/g.304739  ORF Transcript_109314/g.304739 Transcript_109314/m.304739 type:complete len:325 (-) Transcript_109314:197-1171(-)|eukprot:CAMPEP_0179098502 /NCGR_PEP_ID=MMETSP0796-20121207/45396_1 /TAXON_ID=73915 /ORGANISM="Pyrodinium bahamense, Strain pbaha01" /LENGTH=324 /DNA_ID=CAMNT_0020796281 /DNA_START=18 /DNA_END=992 /DNA_ORIENTATION=+
MKRTQEADALGSEQQGWPWAVPTIRHGWAPTVLHVHPDLMAPPCVDADRHVAEGVRVARSSPGIGQKPDVRFGGAAIAGYNCPLGVQDSLHDVPLRDLDRSMPEHVVLPRNLVRVHLPLQAAIALEADSREDEPRARGVQPVDEAEGEVRPQGHGTLVRGQGVLQEARQVPQPRIALRVHLPAGRLQHQAHAGQLLRDARQLHPRGCRPQPGPDARVRPPAPVVLIKGPAHGQARSSGLAQQRPRGQREEAVRPRQLPGVDLEEQRGLEVPFALAPGLRRGALELDPQAGNGLRGYRLQQRQVAIGDGGTSPSGVGKLLQCVVG